MTFILFFTLTQYSIIDLPKQLQHLELWQNFMFYHIPKGLDPKDGDKTQLNLLSWILLPLVIQVDLICWIVLFFLNLLDGQFEHFVFNTSLKEDALKELH